jgi:hypothetical protein
MKLRAGVVVCLFIATVALSACGGDQNDDNANQFRSKLEELNLGARLEAEDPDEPGVVVGSVPGAPGGPMRFAFSFGPDALNILDRYPERNEAMWYNGGDEFYSAISNARPGLDARTENDRIDLEMALEDAGCLVTTGEECKGP